MEAQTEEERKWIQQCFEAASFPILHHRLQVDVEISDSL